jgi:hypothetical protein
VGVLSFLCHWSREGGKNGITLIRVMDRSTIITLRGVQIPALGESAWLAVILSLMVIVVAPAAQARGETREQEYKGDLEQEQLLFLDKLPMLNKEDWSLCMALLLFFLN